MHRELTSHRRRLDAAVRDLWDGIRSRPGRVGLSFLAIAIGIAALSILIAALGGLREKSRRLVEDLGVDVVGIVQHRAAGTGAVASLQDRHALLLAANLAHSPLTTVRLYSVPTLGTQELLSVVATDDAFIRVRQWKLLEGRFLDRWDIDNAERNAVVSDALRRTWGWKVGSIVLLKDLPFKVVGVVSTGGGGLDAEWSEPKLALGERVVLVPKTVAPLWVTDYESPGAALDAIFIRTTAPPGVAGTVSKAQRLLLHPDVDLRNLSWVTPDSLTRRLEGVRNSIGWAAGSVAALCLILGGTTLMSLMISNVRERVTEIGLRRALGASRRDIAALFILEACVVTGAAAVVSSGCAHAVLLVLGKDFPLPLQLGFESAALPVVLAVALGVAFSYWPARFAAGISPSEALRNE